MFKKLQTLVFAAVLFSLVLAPAIASAQVDPFGGQQTQQEVEQALGLGTKDIRVTIASIINVFMGLLGIVAVVIILIGGFLWMTAGGNEDKVKKAKMWIFSGIIGLIIILSAYAIATFVVQSVVNAS